MAVNKLPEELKKFGEIFDSLSRSHGHYYIFQDFLDLSINAWSLNYKINLDSIRKKYTEQELKKFTELIYETIAILDKQVQIDTDFYDVFGTFYEINSLTSKHFSQFFTPIAICRMMAQITLIKQSGSFSDPCSGSARLSLAANSASFGMFHSLVDIDYTCAKMSALNLMYHGINGIVICDNVLFAGSSFRGAFVVNRWLQYQGVPQIEYVTDINEAYSYARYKLGVSINKENRPVNKTNQNVANDIVNTKTNQLSIF